MQVISPDTYFNEMPEMHIVHAHCLMWRMQSLAHRLIEFGWEPAVDRLTPMEAVGLSMLLPHHMERVILEAVLEHGDPRWCAYIRRTYPQYAETREVARV